MSRSLNVKRYTKIVILTGAGISVASGMRPFRGPGGIWNERGMERLSDISAFREEPLEVWRFWDLARKASRDAKPNRAHFALAELEQRLLSRGKAFCLVTQNIDGLHEKAGSRKLVEYHGNVLKTRCSRENCTLLPFEDTSTIEAEVPVCPVCASYLRPDIVMFGESIPEQAQVQTAMALKDCDLFIAIGTSGTVYPAAGFVQIAKQNRARTVYINLQSLAKENPCSAFDEEYLGRAEELVPLLLDL